MRPTPAGTYWPKPWPSSMRRKRTLRRLQAIVTGGRDGGAHGGAGGGCGAVCGEYKFFVKTNIFVFILVLIF